MAQIFDLRAQVGDLRHEKRRLEKETAQCEQAAGSPFQVGDESVSAFTWRRKPETCATVLPPPRDKRGALQFV
ncbi:MAG: hypothetical protein OHK0031_00880 [Anaerolineales bacterium]